MRCIAGLAPSLHKPDSRHTTYCVGCNDGASLAIQCVLFQMIRRSVKHIGVQIDTADGIHIIVGVVFQANLVLSLAGCASGLRIKQSRLAFRWS